jgi:putative transposase
MLQHRLSRNMHFTSRGREYVIERRLPDRKIRIKDVLTDERTAMPEQELVDAVFGSGAELLGHNRNQDVLKKRLKKTGVSDIGSLKEDDPRKVELERRLPYVEAALAARLEKRTAETLKPIIENVAAAIGDAKPPSTSTLSRWLRFYDTSGGDARVLVPATKARGNRKRRFLGRRAQKGDLKNNQKAQERATKVAELLDNAVDEVYLKDQRFTVQAVHDALLVKVDEANRFRDSDDQLPVHDKSSVYDAVNKLDDYDVIEARYGKEVADKKYRAVLQGPRPTRPLERVECDHTTTDLFVIDPVNWLPIGRPFLTWMICVYTKMILGFYISFNPPSYLTVMECLKHAIRPKTYVKRKYPNIRNDWNTYGIPEVLVVDNAREFHGRNLEDACHQLGTVLQFGQRGKPWFRASVERSYRTVATQLHHQLPGTTFSNIFEKADYEPGKTTIITPDTLDEVTHKWIADIYQVSGHRGIRDVPALRWENGIVEWPPALPVNSEFLDVALGYTEERVVSARGIELDSLFYNDDDLAMVRHTLDPRKKVIIKRNPSDLSLIHVYDEKHDKYLPVPAIDQDYTQGLTLYQHTVISRYVREKLKRSVNIIALAHAKQEVREIVEREWLAAGAKKKTRKQLARFRNEGIQENRDGIERPTGDSDETKTLRISGPSKPLLLLQPAPNSLAGRTSDVGTTCSASAAAGEEQATNLKLVQPVNATAAANANGNGKIRKTKKKSAGKQKSDTETASAPETTDVTANQESQEMPQAHPTEMPGEDLDMTGWTGDYNLPK